MSIFQILSDAAYNRKLKKLGIVKDDVIVSSTIGWRRDPINHEDGQTKVEGLTHSGKDEYQVVIRRGKQKD